MVKGVIFVYLFVHYLACGMLYIGYDNKEEGWVYINDFNYEDELHTYIFAFYWIIEVLTTVGYGDYSGTTASELLGSMLIMFFGLLFFSYMLGSVSDIINKSDSFSDQLDERME